MCWCTPRIRTPFCGKPGCSRADAKAREEAASLPAEVDAEDAANFRRHAAIALVFGFNELAKKASTLNEKVFFRLAREQANEDAKALGVGVQYELEKVILQLPGGPPWVRFRASDIELMRAAVARHDAGVLP